MTEKTAYQSITESATCEDLETLLFVPVSSEFRKIGEPKHPVSVTKSAVTGLNWQLF